MRRRGTGPLRNGTCSLIREPTRFSSKGAIRMKFNHLMITGAALLSFSAIAAEEAKKDTQAQGSQAPAASQDQKEPGSAAATGAGTAPGSTGTQSGAEPTDKTSGSAAAGTSASESAAPTKGPEASGSSGTQSGPNPAGPPDKASG